MGTKKGEIGICRTTKSGTDTCTSIYIPSEKYGVVILGNRDVRAFEKLPEQEQLYVSDEVKNALPKFDSKIWRVVMSKLSTRLWKLLKNGPFAETGITAKTLPLIIEYENPEFKKLLLQRTPTRDSPAYSSPSRHHETNEEYPASLRN